MMGRRPSRGLEATRAGTPSCQPKGPVPCTTFRPTPRLCPTPSTGHDAPTPHSAPAHRSARRPNRSPSHLSPSLCRARDAGDLPRGTHPRPLPPTLPLATMISLARYLTTGRVLGRHCRVRRNTEAVRRPRGEAGTGPTRSPKRSRGILRREWTGEAGGAESLPHLPLPGATCKSAPARPYLANACIDRTHTPAFPARAERLPDVRHGFAKVCRGQGAAFAVAPFWELDPHV